MQVDSTKRLSAGQLSYDGAQDERCKEAECEQLFIKSEEASQ